MLTGVYGVFWQIGARGIMLDRIFLIPLSSSADIVPYIYNVLMTIPLGFLLPMIWPQFRSLKKVALAGLLLSLSIEFAQLFTIRTSTVDDLITNTLGAAIGYFIYKILFVIVYGGKKEESHLPKVRHEASYYLVFSFIGVFILYRPM
jgi:glycopeptide antibiotics resistance protein